MLDRNHLCRGLTALARTMEKSGTWVYGGHLGASVISAYYLCRDHGLDPGAAAAIRDRVEGLCGRMPEMFEPLPPSRPDPRLVEERIVEALKVHISQYRISGHNVIFSVLAIKALRDVPEMGTAALMAGLCQLTDYFSRTHPEPYPITEPIPTVEIPARPLSYRDERAMAVEMAHEVLAMPTRYWGIQGVDGHFINMGDSLIQLARLGYADLARQGHDAHRTFAMRLRGIKDDPSRPRIEPIVDDHRSESYWRRELEQGGLDHFIKYSYHYSHLLKLIDDPQVRSRLIDGSLRYILQHHSAAEPQPRPLSARPRC